ncbi:pyridoxal phosphate-dependent aminotransferase [Aquabacterium sp.]|uniref:pyridoxal phosphate-dependent aminotransferase n=1 Tax=Aquabacterium sp. TaxID=1872578 RepID=UPI00248998CA|nr:pyridoxal phosphate-dependent aminotransferase [Aquabacterium sp.]MDI1258364.1 pyridoxal phosphate-dependent aminotransferase [Aquabacterium sp.]
MMPPLNEHGGPDSGPPIAHDFSSNANPLGAPDEVVQAIHAADRQRYPDPAYQALREYLAQVLDVEAGRVLPTAGSSEAIRRLTLAASLQGVRQVWVPQPGYGDYRSAALALGLHAQGHADGEALLAALKAQVGPSLVWLCEPCNPTGQTLPPAFWAALAELKRQRPVTVVLDRAYEPLRLTGQDPVPTAFADQCWQLCSPNKALGLTGVRAGYVIAPIEDALLGVANVQALAPSWVLSAEGVAMLQAWHQAGTQAWLARSRQTLLLWMAAQTMALTRLGWHCQPSVVPFMLARPAQSVNGLRAHGIKLRDATSFGMPGWVRLSAQAPGSQQALFHALAHAEINP